jgi:hypothetical protein
MSARVLGISGDTSCANHEIAKFTRDQLSLNPPGGPTVDDISYCSTDGPSVFTHPLCLNTWRNDVFVGKEQPALAYKRVLPATGRGPVGLTGGMM